MSRILLLLSISFLIISCGKSSEEEVLEAIDQANILLTDGACDEALKTLNDAGYQNKNAKYLATYASAYSCKAGFKITTFFGDDLPNLTVTQSGLFGSLAKMSSSTMESNEASIYTNLTTALDTLLYAGGITSSSAANRSEHFTSSERNAINSQALYYVLAQLGNYLNFYGNADDTTGVKGSGGGTNGCYLDYTDGNAQTIRAAASASSCDTNTEGSANLNGNRSRTCYGIILFNNFLDLVANLSFTGDNAQDLVKLKEDINETCTASAFDMGGTCTVLDLATCVDDTTNYTNAHLERYFALVFENMHL